MADWWLEDRGGLLHKACFSTLSATDIRTMRVADGWSRGALWRSQLQKPNNQVMKFTDHATNTIQGAISMFDNGDHVFVDFLESAPQNRFDPRAFINISRLLIAFAGKRSIDIGAEGFIALTPKSDLYEYYLERFKAYPLLGRNVGIPNVVTHHWIRVYYK